jgi:hypothetical protein
MARYKEYDYRQGKFLPISFDKQILSGTFEYTLNYLIDHELDLSVSDSRYCNDDTGAPANICFTRRLNRFTLRGKRKVNSQWLLYCIVHNLLKVHRYGYGYA